jgi:hypothetical protein
MFSVINTVTHQVWVTLLLENGYFYAFFERIVLLCHVVKLEGRISERVVQAKQIASELSNKVLHVVEGQDALKTTISMNKRDGRPSSLLFTLIVYCKSSGFSSVVSSFLLENFSSFSLTTLTGNSSTMTLAS